MGIQNAVVRKIEEGHTSTQEYNHHLNTWQIFRSCGQWSMHYAEESAFLSYIPLVVVMLLVGAVGVHPVLPVISYIFIAIIVVLAFFWVDLNMLRLKRSRTTAPPKRD